MMTQAVRKYFPENTGVTRPTGGTVLWVEFPRQIDAVGLYRKALEKSISIVPGPLFSPKRQYGNCIRLNCGHPWSERTEEAMITLEQLALRMMREASLRVASAGAALTRRTSMRFIMLPLRSIYSQRRAGSGNASVVSPPLLLTP